MNPRLLVVLALIVAIAIGLFLSFPFWSTWFESGSAATTTPQTTQTPSAKPLSLEEHGPYYDIAGEYPAATPLPGTKGAAAVATMKAFIVDAMVQFKKDGGLDALTPEDIHIQGLDQGRKYALDMTYEVHSSPATVSYVYTIYADTLGAHPNGHFRTFTFDAATGDELSLTDLFVPGADYLGTLSTRSRAELRSALATAAGISEAEVDSGMLDAGTGPDPLNFADFYFDGKDFVLLFPPYQVAPYVAGPQELRIPKTELATLLRASYR